VIAAMAVPVWMDTGAKRALALSSLALSSLA